jgi:hypothetical protein
MIKRGGAFLVTILYIITVVGFALNFHYCCDYITSVKIDAPVKSCSLLTKGKMKCCKDSNFEVKVKDSHQAESPSFLSKISGFKLPKLPFADFVHVVQNALMKESFGKAPPDHPSNSISTFLKNCSFRI